MQIVWHSLCGQVDITSAIQTSLVRRVGIDCTPDSEIRIVENETGRRRKDSCFWLSVVGDGGHDCGTGLSQSPTQSHHLCPRFVGLLSVVFQYQHTYCSAQPPKRFQWVVRPRNTSFIRRTMRVLFLLPTNLSAVQCCQ